MAMKKQDLPEKDCSVCGRPFSWRRKWARDWNEVKYCSKRCRGNRAGASRNSSAGGGEHA
jgi:hypothetical protein